MLGVLAVASNPSPYYGVVGLVVASVIGCGWLVSLGVSFVSLALFLVYLGGMLVVFELLFLSYGKRLVRTNLSCTFLYEWLPSVTVFPF